MTDRQSLQAKIRTFLKKILRDPYALLAIGLFLIGAVMRFYKLFEFATFLGDQGRDAIIVREIATGEHFTAIGPPTSIGQVFLGPFYYYFIAPWLLLFRFNPGGLAAAVAFFSSISILGVYVAVTDMLGKRVAILTAAMMAFSSVLIELSRFSWNPNLLPYFAFFTFYFLYKAFQSMKRFKKAVLYSLLSGAFFSCSIQLHYLALSLALPICAYSVLALFMQRMKFKKILILFASFVTAAVVLLSPLIIFDLRHGFINVTSFIGLLSSGEVAPPPLVQSYYEVFAALNRFALHMEASQLVTWLLLLLLFVSGGIALFKRENSGLVVGCMLTSMVVLARFSGRLIPHYLGVLYIFYYVIIAWVFVKAFEKKKVWIVVSAIVLTSFVYVNSGDYYFFNREPSKPMDRAQKVAKTIQSRVTASSYTLTALPLPDFDSPYRYFLTLWGSSPIPRNSLDHSDELFVMCESECSPIGDSQWDVAYFAPGKIVDEWREDGIYIYKLVR